MEIIRLHYQRGGFDFLKKHSLARNLSSSVSTWEGWDEAAIPRCAHDACPKKPRSRQLQHQVSSSYVVVHWHCHQCYQKLQKHYREWELGYWDWECGWLSLGLSDTWCPSYTGIASLTGNVSCSSCFVCFICRRLLTCTHICDICRNL